MNSIQKIPVLEVNKLKLICFDFDGTLANTMPFLEKNAIALITKYYKLTEEVARKQYRLTTGLPFEQQIDILFPDNSENLFVIREFEHQKISRMLEQKLFPETKRVLVKLIENGYKNVVSSSTTKNIITNYVETKNISKYLTEVLGFHSGFEKGKNHFEYIMKNYNLSSYNLLYIGDSLKDMERASDSNIPFIGRTGPMFQAEDFKLKILSGWHNFPTISSLEEIFHFID